MNFNAAQKLVGALYGNILHRDADQDGFNYNVHGLTNNLVSVKEIMYEFFTSEEFFKKFVVNQTPNELSRNLLACFFGASDVVSADLLRVRDNMIKAGLPGVVTALMEDPRFFDRHGSHGVPRYEEKVQILIGA
ncbi:DUF4214 domain-containing protein [Acidisoma silvae]|uniref:DUF4214 domain-containing protein n=1 Tax=Acidisoma silvae TaxID=2802396 RepID=A0A963YWX4_9PROT|nr:DUF4214 domain-containing protein [Acidisoma silvae]MCB8877658.1 DUF4214 domain-containing protein [Acidisoma silvae]